MNLLLLASWLVPLLLAPAVIAGNRCRWLLIAAPLPALAAAWLLPAGSQLSLPWLLLGTELGMDGVQRLFLTFTALLWLAASAHCLASDGEDPHGGRLRLFMTLAMSGNIGLILSTDMISFYLGFALMGLASFGLVVHTATRAARRAARVYLIMTLASEFLLLIALLLIYQRTGLLAPAPEQLSGGSNLEMALLFVSFAIKAGLFGFHVWLPLAHPAAPVSASAVLSGAMIATALVGWFTFLPLGGAAQPFWGWVFVVSGALGATLAAAIGLLQQDPKVILAYSSISKMSLFAAAIGVALHQPAAAAAIMVAITVYALVHGLCKGALFIGVGVIKQYHSRALFGLLVIPAAILSGAPFAGGAAAKDLLSGALDTGGAAATTVLLFFGVAALVTPMLMVRFLWVMTHYRGTARLSQRVTPWLLLILTAALLPIALVDALTPGSALLWALGLALALLVSSGRAPWLHPLSGTIPAGDLIELFPQRWPTIAARVHSRQAAAAAERSVRPLPIRAWIPAISADRAASLALPLVLLVLLVSLWLFPR
ncbi:proton-conducting transporter membrane subunit [Motiliproteus sediminis]|uniref:proton-conducting transporter transmembrane domain-containing protein n=1 Tax=Motiliproteus sediminis TaxID=1468178 RepID=UPI001AEF8A14|nr:proton-conducting transporter membrane subunit [Motiliproteus sediminis]